MNVARRIADGVSCVAALDPSQLSIRETNPHLDPRWESFVMQHPDASVYHHPAWLAALEREYPRPCVYLICEDSGGKLLGLFPLMYTRGFPFSARSPLIGPRLASLPRTPIAGPLTVDPRATVLLLQEAVRRTSSKAHVRLQIKASGTELGGLVEGIVTKAWRLTYLLQLPGNSGEPFRISNSQNRYSIKKAINKAVANGLHTRLAASEAELATWYRIYLETMRRNVVPARSYRFFQALWESMQPKGLMRLLLAEQQAGGKSRIIGGLIFFNFGQTVTSAFVGSQTSNLGLRPNDIMYWQAINDACREGFRVFDFGEVPDGDEGQARFKLKWGAEPVRLYRYYYPDFQDATHSASDSGTVLERAAKTIWQYLPLTMTSWLGDRVYARL